MLERNKSKGSEVRVPVLAKSLFLESLLLFELGFYFILPDILTPKYLNSINCSTILSSFPVSNYTIFKGSSVTEDGWTFIGTLRVHNYFFKYPSSLLSAYTI